MANAKFTSRLTDALKILTNTKSMKSRGPNGVSLFSPVYRKSKYRWVKVLDSDGILLSERNVDDGECTAVDPPASLLLGVIVQSEDATSQTKPNPLGKASLAHVKNGIWVSVDGGRRRLDRFIVVFVLPKGAAAACKAKFATAKKYVINASDLMPDAVKIEVPRGASAKVIAYELAREVRPFLVGRGRPRSET